MEQGKEREEGKEIKYFKTPSSYPGPWYFYQNKEGGIGGEVNNIHVKWEVPFPPDVTDTLTPSMLCSKDIFAFCMLLAVAG